MDLSNVKLSRENLLDNEYNYLNSLLNKYINRELKKDSAIVNESINNDIEIEI